MNTCASNGFDFAGLRDSVSVQTVFMNKYTPALKQVPNQQPVMELKHKFLMLGAAATGIIHGGLTAHAQAANELSSAFIPIKELLIDVADPLCYVMFVWGCIECIVGRPASGMDRMKYATIGFIAINWIPVIMNVIRGVAPNV
jgi:hypothetical protein